METIDIYELAVLTDQPRNVVEHCIRETAKDTDNTEQYVLELPSIAEFEKDPYSYRVSLQDKIIQKIINTSIDPDPRKRLTAEQILNMLK